MTEGFANESPEELQAPRVSRKLRSTWLSRKPDPNAGFVAILATAVLLVGSLIYWSHSFGLTWAMPVNQESLRAGQWWRLFTALFAHSDIAHFLANSILFFAFGYFLTAYFGLWMFPIAALAFGAITNFIVVQFMEPDVWLLGVSGVVYWMGGAWLTLYFCVDRRGRLAYRLLRSFGVALALLVPETVEAQVSYLAHFVGFVLGVGWALAYFFYYKKTFRAAERYRTIVEEPFPFEAD